MAAPNAFVTLVSSDRYLPGALTLVAAIGDLHTKDAHEPYDHFQTVCLVTPETVDVSTIKTLRSAFDVVVGVEIIEQEDDKGLRLLGRPDLNTVLTKLHIFRLTQYQKIIFLDADVLPVRPLSHLFALEHEFSAVPDVGWPDIFNSGVLVLSPGEEKFGELRDLLKSKGSWDGGDQGLLNEWRGENWNRLSFTYNTTPTAAYTYAPAYERYGSQISAVHFIGPHKPWSNLAYRQPFVGRQPDTDSGLHRAYDYDALVDRWYAVYDRHYRAETPVTTSQFEVRRYVSSWDQHAGTGDKDLGSVPAVAAGGALGLEQLRQLAVQGLNAAGVPPPRDSGKQDGEYRSMPLDGRIDLMRPPPQPSARVSSPVKHMIEESQQPGHPSYVPPGSPGQGSYEAPPSHGAHTPAPGSVPSSPRLGPVPLPPSSRQDSYSSTNASAAQGYDASVPLLFVDRPDGQGQSEPYRDSWQQQQSRQQPQPQYTQPQYQHEPQQSSPEPLPTDPIQRYQQEFRQYNQQRQQYQQYQQAQHEQAQREQAHHGQSHEGQSHHEQSHHEQSREGRLGGQEQPHQHFEQQQTHSQHDQQPQQHYQHHEQQHQPQPGQQKYEHQDDHQHHHEAGGQQQQQRQPQQWQEHHEQHHEQYHQHQHYEHQQQHERQHSEPPRPPSPPKMLWNPALEPPPNIPPTPNAFPADTYFANAWDATPQQPHLGASSSSATSPPADTRGLFSPPPPPEIPVSLQQQGHYRRVTGEDEHPDRHKVKHVFPWEEKPRSRPGRVFPAGESPSPSTFTVPLPEPEPTPEPESLPQSVAGPGSRVTSPTRVWNAQNSDSDKTPRASPPIHGLPKRLAFANAWDTVPSIQKYAEKLRPPPSAAGHAASPFDEEGWRKKMEERSDLSAADGDDEDESEEDVQPRPRAYDSDNGSRSSSSRRSRSGSSVSSSYSFKSKRKEYRVCGVQTDTVETRSVAVQVAAGTSPTSPTKALEKKPRSRGPALLPAAKMSEFNAPGSPVTNGQAREPTLAPDGHSSALSPLVSPREFAFPTTDAPKNTTKPAQTSPPVRPTAASNTTPPSRQTPPVRTTPPSRTLERIKTSSSPASVGSTPIARMARQISNDSSITSPTSSVGPVSPPEGHPIVGSARKGGRVWDPARGVDLFKRGSEEVLARFLRMGSWEDESNAAVTPQ